MILRRLLWIILCLNSLTGLAAHLKDISMSQQVNKTTLYFTIEGSFTHKLFTLPNPNRIVLDLSGTNLTADINKLNLTQSVVEKVRSGAPNQNTLRLVLDVRQNVHVSSAPWQPEGGYNGIRVDIVHGKTATPINNTTIVPGVKKIAGSGERIIKSAAVLRSNQLNKVQPLVKTPNVTLAQQPPITVSHSPSSNHLRDVIIVLDAGHGGKDPGARGPHRSQEKNVTLAITLKLKQLIDRQPGMRAVLTRSGDYYVGLRKRLDIARKYNGDVFVSIHADAFNNPHSNGASVFALSQSGATSEAARWIAEKENYSELGGVNLGDLDDTNGVVRSVLIDLSQTATINSGLQMGGRVLSQLNGFTNLHNNRVEQARFMVLKSPDIPSILVETGFISNPREERNLTSAAYQTRLSQAIFQGVKTYFWDNPPHGTRIEAMANNHLHVVRAGETLPTIASRYHVKVNSLQAANNLTGTRLRPGQKLVIPSAWA